jgi:hypothetical protein
MSRCMIKMKLLNHPYANQSVPFTQIPFIEIHGIGIAKYL